MKSPIRFALPLLLIASVFIGFGFAWQEPEKKAEVASDKPIDEQFVAIDSMHHFMEYISQPSYLALKEKLAEEPTDRRVYRTIKSHALILAETSALVAQRVPKDLNEEQTKQWKQISLDVYNSGKVLYGANGDFAKAKESFGAMIDNCNHCHEVFDNGKHQLEK
jgi:hypothetical protein